MRVRSTFVAVVAVIWMGAVIIGDALDGKLSGFALFAAFVLAVGLWEISRAVRRRTAE
jgi:hypothetical protein